MADHSKIEWTDATWNPIRARNLATGGMGHFCTHVSEGCRNCYAERMQPRFGNAIRYAAQDMAKVKLQCAGEELLQPLHWRKPRQIFVCSMTDLFAAFVADDWIDRVFAVMALAPQHTFQVLTKRPERMRAYCQELATPHRIARRILDMVIAHEARVVEQWPVRSIGDDIDMPDDVTLHRWPLPNVWKGTSVEDQPTANERIPILLDTPAALHWISAEPLLGSLELDNLWLSRPIGETVKIDALTGDGFRYDGLGPLRRSSQGPRLGWVVAGGESGAGARPMHPDWARSLRDQCAAAGVAYHFKQWGEWHPGDQVKSVDQIRATGDMGRALRDGHAIDLGDQWTWRLGKARSGRLLDGVLHAGFPEVRA